MNTKLIQKVKSVTARPGVAVLLFVIIVGIGVIQFATTDDIYQLDNLLDTNMSDNETVNESVLNQSKYYDTEDKVCRSPEINDTNKSQLKACVSNQTSVS